MAWFPWAASGWPATLDTHDGLCRQLAHDLGVAVVCVQLPTGGEGPLLQTSESAVLALRTLAGRPHQAGRAARTACWWAATAAAAHARAMQAAWRLARAAARQRGRRCWALCPLVKPDFNTRQLHPLRFVAVFSRTDAIRAWHSFLHGQWDLWDERAVLMHGNAPIQTTPVTVLMAAEQDVAHDDAIQLHDWLRAIGGRRCEFFGAPRMTADFARMQHASEKARKLMLDALAAFSEIALLRS
jgi:acetyl esterase/lipase